MSRSYPQQGVMSAYQLTAHNHSGVGQGGLVPLTSITGHNVAIHNALNIDADLIDGIHIPNTNINVLTDHNKIAHDALALSHDSLSDVSVDDHHNQLHEAEHEVGGGDLVSHDALTDFIGAEHLSLPNTIGNVLSNHTKAVHDALSINADQVDGEHVVAIVTNARVKAHFPDTIANVLSNHTKAVHDALLIATLANTITLGAGDSIVQGGTKLSIEAGATGIYSETIRDDTTVADADMMCASDIANIRRSTSGEKYKDKIKDLELDSSLIYNLKPRSFNSKCSGDDKNKRFLGLIAEEIEQYYPEIVKYNKDKEVESYDSKMLMTLILAEIQKLNGRLSALEN